MEKKYVCGLSMGAQEIRKTCFTIILVHALIFNVPGWIVDIVETFKLYGGEFGFKILWNAIFNHGFSTTAKFIFNRVIVFIILNIWLGRSEINVTSERVYGRVGFGERVEIPISQIKSISTCLFKKGICIYTTGKRFRFYHISNFDAVIHSVRDLITNGVNDTNEENKVNDGQPQSVYSYKGDFNGFFHNTMEDD